MELLSALGIDVKILVAQLLNFLVLAFVLYKVGYKPILKLVNERTAKIEQGIKDADEAKLALANATAEQARLMAAAKAEAQVVLDKAKEQAVVQGDALVTKAKAEAEQVIVKAKQDIRLEHDKMMTEAKAELSSVVVLATERILKAKLDANTDKQLVEKTLADLK